MSEVVHRIDAPLITSDGVAGTLNAIKSRITQVHIRTRHIDLGAQDTVTIRKLAVAHILE